MTHLIEESIYSSFNYPGGIYVFYHNSTRKKFKVVQIHVFKMGGRSEIFLFTITAIGSLFPNLKSGSIRGLLSSSRSQRSELRAHAQH